MDARGPSCWPSSNARSTRDSLAGQLRVGDQQLIEIAKALSLATDILIMDEPTSALTESEVARLFRVIERLRARGVTVLYISHKMDEVFRLADRIAVLRDGRLVETLDRARRPTPRRVTHLMVGREIEETDLSNPRAAGDVVLAVEHLWLPWPGHARALAAGGHFVFAAARRNPGHRRPDGRRAAPSCSNACSAPATCRRAAASRSTAAEVAFRHPCRSACGPAWPW